MIVCRTPYRISFFGGGTDFPGWYQRHGGSVLSTSIDKYCYLTCRYLPPFFDHKIRVVWSKIENCKGIEEVTHPAVKGVVKHMGINRCLEISHVGDLPARSGMGTSSSFTVGLINALSALQGKMLNKHELAQQSIFIEQQILKESVGSQDQVAASYGGLNHITFHRSGEISVVPVTISNDRRQELEQHTMLFYTGIGRTSSDITKSFTENFDNKKQQLDKMSSLVTETISILNSNESISSIGELLLDAWKMKRKLSTSISNQFIDNLMDKALEAGAIGGKITGAGGGGFLLIFAAPEKHDNIRMALSDFLHVPIKFEFNGSQIIFASNDTDYSLQEKERELFSIEPFQEIEDLMGKIDSETPAAYKLN